MMDKFKYTAKLKVRAVQWHGDNLDEIKELLKGVVDEDETGDPYVYADEIEPMFISSLGYRPGYMILKTECDEFDPGMWIVVYEDGEFEGMDDEQFTKMFRKGD
jgi:hypothetical protein